MSLFGRSEARREKEQAQQSPVGTADVAAMNDARASRSTTDSRVNAAAAAAAQTLDRREQQLWRQEQEDRRAAERRAVERNAAAQGPDTQPPAEVEDAVVTREHSAAGDMPVVGDGGRRLAPLFSTAVAQDFRARWDAVQSGFVDDPRQAVRQADELVAQVMTTLAQNFADERKQLEAHMRETASTENLRVALQRYRSFFQRLLTL
jgi:hypothetical protein